MPIDDTENGQNAGANSTQSRDEAATMQAADGAPGTKDAVETQLQPAPASLIFTDAEKAKIRANVRWIMAELDYARSGRNAEERADLNP